MRKRRSEFNFFLLTALNGRREINTYCIGGRTIAIYVRQRHEDSDWVVVGPLVGIGIHPTIETGRHGQVAEQNPTQALGHGSGTTGPRHRSGASAASYPTPQLLPILLFHLRFFKFTDHEYHEGCEA